MLHTISTAPKWLTVGGEVAQMSVYILASNYCVNRVSAFSDLEIPQI